MKTALLERLTQGVPGFRVRSECFKGRTARRESIGKPFDLEFTDAIDGSTVSMKNLKGKVVVIDFWATWCGPCVAEMPKMKELYAKYRDQGVEFIGVSLDQPKEQGGLDSLKKFVKENGIEWPQYYQGNTGTASSPSPGASTRFPACSWSTPRASSISVEARGKLEKMIPELLEKKTKVATAGAAGAGGK